MSEEFSYIRNRISEYRKSELLKFSFNILERNKENKTFPIWYVFTLIKWVLIYGEKKYPSKELNEDKFIKLLNQVTDFNKEHISYFIKQKGKLLRAFQILYYQQFYLQKQPHISKLYCQAILFYEDTGRKYNINNVFEEKTGLTVIDFLELIKYFYCHVYIELLSSEWRFYGYFPEDVLQAISEIVGAEKVQKFIDLLTLTSDNAKSNALNYRNQVKNENLQTMEMTFLTLSPFIYLDNKLKLIHKRLFNYTFHYFIYDFLKSNDEQFTTEFGYRLEKYVELGLRELQLAYKSENQLRSVLPKTSNVVDFMIEGECIYIECKASEINPHAAINPTDDNINTALKKTLLKAYFNQLCNVSKELSPESENWGIIITYKEYYWSHFVDLFELSDTDTVNGANVEYMPPENVFIMDIEAWEYLLCVVKQKSISIRDILQAAKTKNSNPETRVALFKQHLEIHEIEHMTLDYLDNAEQYFKKLSNENHLSE
jgi:hypothetical protein